MAMIMKNKNLILGMMGIFLTLVLVLSVSAFGSTIIYDSDSPLYLNPGYSGIKEVTKVKISELEGLKRVSVSLTSGSEIARLIDSELDVSSDNAGSVKVQIDIPANAAIGTEYNLGFKFEDITSSEEDSGTVGFKMGGSGRALIIVKNLPGENTIQPVETPSAENNNIWWIVGILVIILIILFIIFYSFGNKKKGKKR